MYREGYFRQYLNIDGWQQESYPENDFFNLPVVPETKSDGSPLLISVPFPGREVWARIWRIQVGRVPLYLLDTNISQRTSSSQSGHQESDDSSERKPPFHKYSLIASRS